MAQNGYIFWTLFKYMCLKTYFSIIQKKKKSGEALPKNGTTI